MLIGVLSRKNSLYANQRFKEAAQALGHTVKIIDPLKCVLFIENAKPAMRYAGKALPSLDVIIPRVGVTVAEYAIAVSQQFEMLGVPLVNSSAAIMRARDKLRCLQILAGNGIPIPRTVLVRSSKYLDAAINLLDGPPVILKFMQGTHGTGVILSDSMESTKSVLDTLWVLEKNIIVQEFVKESYGSDIRFIVVGNRVIGAMKRTARDGEFRSNVHRGGKGIPIEPGSELEKLALEATSLIGLDVAGVDILLSTRGPLVIEVNPSPGFRAFEAATGIDVAHAIIEYALELASSSSKNSTNRASSQKDEEGRDRAVHSRRRALVHVGDFHKAKVGCGSAKSSMKK